MPAPLALADQLPFLIIVICKTRYIGMALTFSFRGGKGREGELSPKGFCLALSLTVSEGMNK